MNDNPVRKQKHYFSISLLPNLVTLFNLFSGFLALLMAVHGKITTAVWLIVLSLVWDSLDGNIARMLNNPTPFGRELDSLADMVSFVAAPALIVSVCCPYGLNPFFLCVIFLYLACGAYRLGRFNVQPPLKRYFEGLPTPASAVALCTTLLAFRKNGWVDIPSSLFLLMVLIVILSGLMASKIPYPKISAMPFSRWQTLFYGAFILFMVFLFTMNFETALTAVFLLFVFFAPPYFLSTGMAEKHIHA